MVTLTLSALFALLLWWASTGIVLYLDRRPQRTYTNAMRGASLVGALAMLGLLATREMATVAGACLAFTCAVLVWGWHEMSFLTGRLTGTRRHACEPGCQGPRHFVHATQAIIHHELAVAATLVLLVTISWQAANPVGAATFGLLWVMRLSAKLNLFLGVRNPGTELLPPQLDYLASFFGRRSCNALLPLSIAGTALLVAWLTRAALEASSPFASTAHGLVAALAALALLEHVFLVLPWSAGRLWSWTRRPGSAPDAGQAEPLRGCAP